MVVCTYIMNNIFTDDKVELKNKTADLMNSNLHEQGIFPYHMHNSNTTFQVNYKQKIFEYSAFIHDAGIDLLLSNIIVPVCPKYEEEFEILYNETIRLTKDMRDFQHYIRTVLNECENMKDVYVLFSGKFHQYLPTLGGERSTLDAIKLAAILPKLKPMETLLQQRVLRKLIQG